MRHALTTLTLLSTILVSCSKSSSEPSITDNTITLTPSAVIEQKIVASGPKTFWKSVVNTNKSMNDSGFVRMMYDAYNSSNAMQYSIVDTVIITPNTVGVFSKLTDVEVSVTWTAKNVKILKAWSKSGIYKFQY